MTRLKGIAKGHNPLIKVFEWVVLIVVFSMLLIGLWGVIWGGRSDTAALKWLQFLQSLGVFLLPAIVAACLWSERPWHYLHLDSLPNGKSALFAVVIIIFALPMINMVAYLNQQLTLPAFLHGLEEQLKAMEDAAQQLTERFLQTDSAGGLIVNILLMALMPAICEETCFRGILLRLFSGDEENRPKITTRQHIAIWITACIFSLAHFQMYGFLPRMLLGALLGYLLVWTGSLWTPVIAHFTNNACSVTAYYIVSHQEGIYIDEIDTFGTGDTLWLGILSMVLVTLMILWYIKTQRYEAD